MQETGHRKQPPPPPPEVANRRVGQRQPLQLRIDVVPLLDGSHQLQLGRPRRGVTLDVNEHGILCSRVGFLPLGGVVRLFIRLPDLPEQPLACHARVVRCDLTTTPCYGLRLIDLPIADVQRLRAYGAELQRSGQALSWMYRFDA